MLFTRRVLFVGFLVLPFWSLSAYFEPVRTDWSGTMRPLEVLEWRLIHDRGREINRQNDNVIQLILVAQHEVKDLAVREFTVDAEFSDRETGDFIGAQTFQARLNTGLKAGKKRTIILPLKAFENRPLFERLRYATADTVNVNLTIKELKDSQNKPYLLGTLH